MISKYRHKELNWIDLDAPTTEELLYVIEQYSIPLSIEEELRVQTEESKTLLYSGFIFLSLYFPKIVNEENIVIKNKIIFVINNNFILTIHDGKIDAISEFLKNLEIDTTLPEQLQIKHTDLLSFYLIKNLYLNLKEQLVVNSTQIKSIENKLNANKTKDVSITIFNKIQNLINIEETIGSHDKILQALSQSLVRIFGEKFENYSLIIAEIFYEIKLTINSQNKSLVNLYNVNNSLLADKNSRRIKLLIKLSIVSLIALIATSFYVITNI